MTDPESQRQAAVERLRAKRHFTQSLSVYVLVNGLLVAIWAMDTSDSFWPIWPILGWGIAIVLQFWNTYIRKPVTEDDIQREIERGS